MGADRHAVSALDAEAGRGRADLREAFLAGQGNEAEGAFRRADPVFFAFCPVNGDQGHGFGSVRYFLQYISR